MTMKEFTIKQIESFTGIKAHTIRAWEQRYGFFTSKRKKSNVRYFTITELQSLLKVCFLYRLGYKLNKIDKMSREELEHLINKHVLENTENAAIQKLLIQTIQLDIDSIEDSITQLIQEHDFEQVLTEILWPFLNKIGILWNTTIITPRHESLITEIIRRKLYTAIDQSMKGIPSDAPSALLFCAENEYQDIHLLSMQYILQAQGIRAINLGADLPADQIQYIKHMVSPSVIILHGTRNNCKNKNIQKTVQDTLSHFPDTRLIISGQKSDDLKCMKLPDIAHIIENVKDVKKILNTNVLT